MNTRDRDGTEVLTPTESRQASPKQANFRVLVISLAAITAIGVALVGAFWFTTPVELKSPSGPSAVSEPAAAPGAPPAAGTDPANAPPEVVAPAPSSPMPAAAP